MALIAKTLTSTIPIFTSGIDLNAGVAKFKLGRQANVTRRAVRPRWAKAHQVLHELVPQAALIALLLNPDNSGNLGNGSMSIPRMKRTRARGVMAAGAQGGHRGEDRRGVRDACGATGQRRGHRATRSTPRGAGSSPCWRGTCFR